MKSQETSIISSLRGLCVFLVSTLVLAGCNFTKLKNADDDLNSSVGLTGPAFSELQEKIFSPRCVQCHVQYSSYGFVKRDLAAIEIAVMEDRMPKDSNPLSAELKQLLTEWIEAGAPNTIAEVLPEPPIEGLQPTWDSLYSQIFVPKCVVCHNPNGEANWIDVSSRPGMTKTLLKHINFSDPEASTLILRLRDPEEPMPPPPPFSNIPRLSEEEIGAVIQWIQNGLP